MRMKTGVCIYDFGTWCSKEISNFAGVWSKRCVLLGFEKEGFQNVGTKYPAWKGAILAPRAFRGSKAE